MSINYDDLRKIALEIPEVKKLLIERRQIVQDANVKGSYSKPVPHLTPSNDKYHQKKYLYDKSKDHSIQKIKQERLKENAKKVEKAVYVHLKKTDAMEFAKGYKQYKPDELVTLIEKGHDAVIQQRRDEQEQIKNDVELTKTSITKKNDRLIAAFERLKEDWEENERDIERDKGFSR